MRRCRNGFHAQLELYAIVDEPLFLVFSGENGANSTIILNSGANAQSITYSKVLRCGCGGYHSTIL